MITVVDFTSPEVGFNIPEEKSIELGSPFLFNATVTGILGSGAFEFSVNGTTLETGSWMTVDMLFFNFTANSVGSYDILILITDENDNQISSYIRVTFTIELITQMRSN